MCLLDTIFWPKNLITKESKFRLDNRLNRFDWPINEDNKLNAVNKTTNLDCKMTQ